MILILTGKYTHDMRCSFAFAIMVALFAACSTKEIDTQTQQPGSEVFYASFEQPSDIDTRVYANEDLFLRWTADDRVSIFNKNTYNQQYKFTGETGDNAGGFDKVAGSEFTTGNAISHIVSVYPYLESTRISESETITVTLPAEQHYAENTFGLGANSMVSVSSDSFLQYKNVGGYLVLKLYGDGFSVSSITLKGNTGEKIAGKATVTMPLDGVPSTTMADDASSEITLTCATPVRLGANAEESTQFWFVIPPVAFSKGITITVRDAFGGVFQKSTSKSISIERSSLISMAPVVVIPDVTLSDYDYKIIHKDQYSRGKPKYYRVDPGDVEFCDPTDFNSLSGWIGIDVNSDGILLGDGDGGISKNPISPVLIWSSRSSIDLLDYVETYAEQLSDVVSAVGINPEYRFSFAGFDEKGDIVINMTDNDPAKVPYISDDYDMVNQNLFVSLDGSIVSINLNYVNSGSLAVGHTPLIFVQSIYSGIILAECFIKLEIVEDVINIDPAGPLELIRHSAEFDYEDIPATGTYGENGIGQDFVAPNERFNYEKDAFESARELSISWDEMNTKVFNRLGMTFQEFLAEYDLEHPVFFLREGKDGRLVEPGDVSDYYMSSFIETDISYFSDFYGEGVSLHYHNPADWMQNTPIMSLSLNPNVEINGLHFVYVVLNPFNRSNFNIIIKFVYNVKNRGSIETPQAIDLGLPSGIKWASFNLGASKPEEYGDYYSWGETESYDNLYSSELSNTLGDVLNSAHDAASVSLGGTWRIPTQEEWTELSENCNFEWTSVEGIYGYKISGKNNGFESASIFLPAAGFMSYGNFYQISTIYTESNYGDYVCSSKLKPEFHFTVNSRSLDAWNFFDGRTIRPVCD